MNQKKGNLESLKEQKRALLEAGAEVQGTNLDDGIIKTLMDSIDHSLQAVEHQGQELSSKMVNDAQKLESIRKATEDELESAITEKQRLESKKALLDKFHLGGALDKGMSELDAHVINLDAVKNKTIQAMQELSKVSSQLDGL